MVPLTQIPIGNVVKGHANEILGLNVDLSTNRLNICKKCPLYSLKWGGICNDKLWLDPDTNEVSTKYKDGYVQGCGCRLPAKTTLYDAECIAGKW